MGEVEKILKTVDMDGEQVEIWMTKMMDPCTAEEFEAMSLEERGYLQTGSRGKIPADHFLEFLWKTSV